MRVRGIGENCDSHTGTLGAFEFSPKVLDRMALEDKKEKVHGTIDRDDSHYSVNYVDLVSFASES